MFWKLVLQSDMVKLNKVVVLSQPVGKMNFPEMDLILFT